MSANAPSYSREIASNPEVIRLRREVIKLEVAITAATQLGAEIPDYITEALEAARCDASRYETRLWQSIHDDRCERMEY